LMEAPEERFSELTEELVAMGEIGTRVCIEMLREIKRAPSPHPSPSRGEGERGGE
jgi:hypothetical protein